jgi:hypothetical protein
VVFNTFRTPGGGPRLPLGPPSPPFIIMRDQVQYQQLNQEQKVAFYNDLCEDPFTGDPATIDQATTALLKASGWSNDEINDNFKGFLDERGWDDGQPSKCTVDLGLEAPPAPVSAEPALAPTPAKRGRKKATPTAQAATPTMNLDGPQPEAAANGEASAEKPKRGANLIPRQPKVEDNQHLYPGLGSVSGIRLQFKNLAGPEGCTFRELVNRFNEKGVSSSAKNATSEAFVRGYVNNGLRPDVDLFRLTKPTDEEIAAAKKAEASAEATQAQAA